MLEKYFAYLLVNNDINPLVYGGFIAFQMLQILFIIIAYGALNTPRNIFLLSIIETLPLAVFILTVQITLIILLIWSIFHFKSQYSKRTKSKDDKLIAATKIINYLLTSFRTIWILPLNYLVFSTFSNSEPQSVEIALCCSIYTIYILIILPLCMLSYWNKFPIRTGINTYPYVINLASSIHVYLHVFMFGFVFFDSIFPYMNMVFFIIAIAVVFWNSPSHYKNNKLITYLQSLIVALFLTGATNFLRNDHIDSFADFFLFILLSVSIAYLITHLEYIVTKQLLFNHLPSKQPVRWYHFYRFRHHNQVLLYCLLNYNSTVKNTLIFLFQYQSASDELNCLSRDIFNKLKQGETKTKLFPLIKNFFLQIVLKQYNPQVFVNYGEKQIQKMIHEKGKLFSLIVQLMMIRDQECILKENLRKAYYFLKQHQKFIKKSPSDYTLIAKIQLNAMLCILEQQLAKTIIAESTINNNYSLKIEQYFQYQKSLEEFNRQVSNVCATNLQFWTEMLHKEQDQIKINQLIKKSYNSTQKLQAIFKNLTNTYPKSCIVTYDTVFCFSQLVLNCELSSLLNPFVFLNNNYSEQINILKKEKLDQFNFEFNQIYQVPSCMISIDINNLGTIEWQNESFRKQFKFLNRIKANNDSKTINIQELILPFYRKQHQQFLDQFSKQQTLRYHHDKVVIFKSKQKQSVIEQKVIEIQLFSSLKFGLKNLVFFKKAKKEQKMLLVIDQDLKCCYLSQSLINEWQLENKNDDEINSLIEIIFSRNQDWPQLKNENELNASLEIDFNDFYYDASIVKIVQDTNQKKYFYFQIKSQDSQSQGTNKEKSSTEHQSLVEQMHKTQKTQNFHKIQSQESKYFQQIFESFMKKGNMPFSMSRITLDKNEVENKLEKIYKKLSKRQVPKNISIWRILILVLSFLIFCTIITNIIISSKRQGMYEKDIEIVKSYNLLIQYIARTSITLRQYNYEAYMDVKSPRLKYYKNQLKIYKSIISDLLQSTSDQLKGTLPVMDFRQTGQFSKFNQSQYVAIGNYILSSVTYLADQPVQAFNFPFLSKQFFWFFGMTKAQSNFLNSAENSIYLTLIYMIQSRLRTIHEVEVRILNVQNQLFIYPTIVGLSLLFVLLVYSIFIEIKSSILVNQTSSLFSCFSQSDKRKKIQRIIKFKEMFITNIMDKNSYDPNSDKLMTQQSHIQTKQDSVISQSQQIMDINTPSNTTDRQLNLNKLNQDQFSQVTQEKQQTKKNDTKLNLKNLEQKNTTTKIQIICSNKFIFLFYFVVTLPFAGYFIGIFIGGYHLNSTILSYLNYGSQLYHFNTFHQYMYIYTRQTFMFQYVIPGASWGALFLPGLLTVYDISRYIDYNITLFNPQSGFVQMKQTLDKGNLCEYLDMFEQQSIYYNITYSKEQCKQIGNGIFTKGFKSAYSYYVQICTQLISRNMNPELLKRQERIAYLSGDQLRTMKNILSYFEQFHKIMFRQFQQSIYELVSYFIQFVNISSISIILGLSIILGAVYYRFKKMKNDSLKIQSILRLISFNEIKEDKKLRQKFNNINYQFYQ